MSARGKIGVTLLAGGSAIGVGAWAIDVNTCPGEVKRTAGDVKITYCDEDPENNDWFNNPGTPEQKATYAGFIIAAAGLALVIRDNSAALAENIISPEV